MKLVEPINSQQDLSLPPILPPEAAAAEQQAQEIRDMIYAAIASTAAGKIGLATVVVARVLVELGAATKMPLSDLLAFMQTAAHSLREVGEALRVDLAGRL